MRGEGRITDTCISYTYQCQTLPPPPSVRGRVGDFILFDAEYSLEPWEFQYIRAFDVKFYTV